MLKKFSQNIFLKLVFIFTFIFLISIKPALAYKCPNYEFKQNFVKGSVNEDIRAIQEILNLDKRTTVAYKGLGSKGNETALYGVATRESMKRFQALFIEYIGVADGKFNDKTRAVMNNVCKGPFFTGGGTSVYDFATSTIKDTLPPIIGVAAVSTTTLDTPFRAYIASSEAIKTPNLSGLIIAGATAGDIRKTSSTTYTFLVTPNLDAKGFITLQFEADSLSDLAGNKNPTASNEWRVFIIPITAGTDASTTTFPDIDFPVVTPSPGVDCSTVGSVSVYDYSNPCYGRAPTTPTGDSGSGGGGGGGGGMEQIMQMLQGLMKGLTGMGGGGAGNATDGSANGPGMCMCAPGITTINYSPLAGGAAGRVEDPGVTGGKQKYVGRFESPILPCGVQKYPSYQQCAKPCKDTYQGQCDMSGCCNPQNDSTNMPVVGKLAPSPTGMYVN